MRSETKPSATIDLRGRNVTRAVVVLLATTVLIASFLTPWWTRAVSIDWNEENPREMPGVEGIALSYGPFMTPGAGSISTDASREAAVAVLGIAFLLTAFLAQGSVAVRLLAARGRIQASRTLPVRLAIASFVVGAFAILWAGLFLPLAGANPGWLYGAEVAPEIIAQSQYAESSRYANAGFFFGIVGLVAYPLFLWVDAAGSRRSASAPVTTPTASVAA